MGVAGTAKSIRLGVAILLVGLLRRFGFPRLADRLDARFSKSGIGA